MNLLKKISNKLKDNFEDIYCDKITINNNNNSILLNAPYYCNNSYRSNNNINQNHTKENKTVAMIFFLIMFPIILIGGIITFALDDYVTYWRSGINTDFENLGNEHNQIYYFYKKWNKSYLLRTEKIFWTKCILFFSIMIFLFGFLFEISFLLFGGYLFGILASLFIIWRHITFKKNNEFRKYKNLIEEINRNLCLN